MPENEPAGSDSGLEPEQQSTTEPTKSESTPEPATAAAPRRRRAASRPVAAPAPQPEEAQPSAEAPLTESAAAEAAAEVTATEPAAKRTRVRKTATATTRRRATKAAAEPAPAEEPVPIAAASAAPIEADTAPAAVEPVAPAIETPAETPVKTRRTRKRAAAAPQMAPEVHPFEVPAAPGPVESAPAQDEAEPDEDEEEAQVGAEAADEAASQPAAPQRPGMLIFQAPVVVEPVRRSRAAGRPVFQTAEPEPEAEPEQEQAEPAAAAQTGQTAAAAESGDHGSRRRRRRSKHGADLAEQDEQDEQPSNERAAKSGRRGRQDAESAAAESEHDGDTSADQDGESGDGFDGDGGDGSSRRRRRRRRRQTAEDLAGAGAGNSASDDPPNTVVKIREPRERRSRVSEPDSVRTGDDVLGVRGSVRLAAKQQRRRDGRSTRSRRAPIVTEAEFLARRESVERVMVVRQSASRTQIGVLEDGVLVEHYVNRESSVSYVGNIYLGKVQNVLPSMEAAFVDINKGRNAVLYAGEVNFSAAGLEGQPKRIESALKSGQPVLVQVTKDPIGHKGARLTSQISLPGRFLVYIPGGSMMGISRKLPDTERTRLKQILKKVVPEDGGVIVRTAAEGASEDELAKDVERLVAQWEEIERRSRTANAPALLYGEPDLTVRVVRDIFNEDFTKLIVSGEEAYKTIHEYIAAVAPELAGRIEQWTSESDIFSAHRVDEQLAKGLDRKVWLPSGGSLVIDRTEAMVVIDVNTGKFTGQGSNSLEETVTRNNLEAAEEIVRQLRLRDLGGIIVIDFIDMVLESNRELVLRRLLECLGRDRTKHQVAEVTSLGLVQMTRKRVGQGLIEAFSESCEHCNGRGIIVHMDPVEPHGRRSGQSERSGKNRGESHDDTANGAHAADADEAHGKNDHGRGQNGQSGAAQADGFSRGHSESAAESRANRRRRRKGKYHDSDSESEFLETPDTSVGVENDETESAAPASSDSLGAVSGSSADEEPAAPREPLNLRAHAEDPDAVGADMAEAARPRKRRRAASRPAGPAGAAVAVEASDAPSDGPSEDAGGSEGS
jgi:ribonuclease E